NGTPLACPRYWSRMDQRPSCSNKARTTRTGPQFAVSRTWGSVGSLESASELPSRIRRSLGRIATRRSLRPRSATTRCLTLPPSRKASTTRTYSLTVPLEERTLTVLGYMRTIITTDRGESREISGNQRKTLDQIVTTLLRPPRSGTQENKDLRRASGLSTPNM